MQLEWTFFQSKVARRIFLLFVLSALIPVLFLAIFQIIQIDRQLHESSLKQVRQDAKNIGMTLIGRVFQLENELNLLGRALEALPEDSELKHNKTLQRTIIDFSAVTLVPKNGSPISLKGPLIRLKDNTLPDLPKDGSWIGHRTYSSNGGKKGVLLAHRLKNDAFLLGKPANLWSFDLPASHLKWILGPNDQLIRANTIRDLPNGFPSKEVREDSGALSWQAQDAEYLVGYWKLFLRQRLNAESWTVVLAAPKSGVLSQSQYIYAIFIPIIVFALLLSMLLSQAQIRRYLIPLEKLTKATKRIAKRDFDTPVEVKSGDEFEELGEAFNAMAKRLQQQFQTLSILSVLDQTILSSENKRDVLRIIFEGIDDVVEYDLLVLGVFEQDHPQRIQLLIDDPAAEHTKVEYTTVSEAECSSLRHNKEMTLNLSKASLPNYLKIVSQFNIHYLIVFPILHKDQPIALVALGFHDIHALRDCNTKALHDIFYRATVAFTHAEWEERLYQQAHFDDLTGLPNRVVLRAQLNQALSRAYLENLFCVLLYIDLDNFKDVNDTLGHSVGDLFLEKVGQKMLETVAHAGLLARIGGDEFTLLITDVKTYDLAKEKAKQIAEKILKALSEPFNLEGMQYHATASIGIVIYPTDCKSSDELLKFADLSMFQAKEKGKNRYVFFSTQLEKFVRERNELIQEMHIAVEEKQFLIHYQPKFDPKNNTLVGAEALIRWQHPTRGLLNPDAFLPLAEETDLIFSIGEWVVQSACEQLKRWQEQGLNLSSLAINVAPKQFTQDQFIFTIKEIIKKTRVNPRDLEFEVTESAFIENFIETNEILKELHKLGCRISMDDFGTGYSSMHYLRMLPLNAMKIDRVFIKGLPDDRTNLSIIKAIVTLAESLDLSLVAEGIETKAQSDLLTQLGCRIQQGFYFSAPCSADEFAREFLKQ